MDPVLNQTTTTRTTYGQTPITRDFNNWSDRELRKELKRYGEKVPRETQRSQLLNRLQFFELNQRSGSFPVSNQSIPISQSITSQTHSTVPVQQVNRDINTWSDRELRKELKRYGEKVPRETQRAELLRRLDVHQRSSHVPISPVKSTVSIIGTTHLSTQTVPNQQKFSQQIPNQTSVINEDTKMYNNWSEKEMRRELKKKYGDRVPKNTQRMELIRRLNCCHNNEKNTGYTRVTGLPIQHTLPVQQQYPVQQNIPQQQYQQSVSRQNQQIGFPQQNIQQSQTGYPQQQYQQSIPQQNQQIGFPQQQNQQSQTGYPQQQNQQCSNHRCPHQTGSNHHN